MHLSDALGSRVDDGESRLLPATHEAAAPQPAERPDQVIDLACDPHRHARAPGGQVDRREGADRVGLHVLNSCSPIHSVVPSLAAMVGAMAEQLLTISRAPPPRRSPEWETETSSPSG